MTRDQLDQLERDNRALRDALSRLISACVNLPAFTGTPSAKQKQRAFDLAMAEAKTLIKEKP